MGETGAQFAAGTVPLHHESMSQLTVYLYFDAQAREDAVLKSTTAEASTIDGDGTGVKVWRKHKARLGAFSLPVMAQ
jgi:hypothetical protein